MRQRKFYEFFAGGGMARCGLGPNWSCTFANDFDVAKAASYRTFFPSSGELVVKDIALLQSADLPGSAELAWASFPCQDLSLAGAGAGLKGERSGSFWPFWRIMEELTAEGRSPKIIALENVCGTLTSHGGKDFSAICHSFAQLGFRVGAMMVDAKYFVPQSRPRLFVIGVRAGVALNPRLHVGGPISLWHPPALVTAAAKLPRKMADQWVWWSMLPPPPRRSTFADIVEDDPEGVNWHTPEETRRILGMMSDLNRAKVRAAMRSKTRLIGGVYKRTRIDASGERVQRAEVRFDNVAGCLRTPSGGSSRQTVLLVDGPKIRSRLLSPREAARLMGLPENYELPTNYNAAYHLAGDGVVVPVVKYLTTQLLEPILDWDSSNGPQQVQQRRAKYRARVAIS